jgi:Tfp pilus tip-associated adhesin PilY1
VIGGARRPVLSVAGKDGMLRAIDRKSHEQIYEVPLTAVNALTGVIAWKYHSKRPKLA